MKQEFAFINKIWLPVRGKRKGMRVLLLVLAGLILLLTLFQALMDGFDTVSWVSGVAVPLLLLLIGLMNTGKGGYTTSLCRVEMDETSVTVMYPALNREDGKGPCMEVCRSQKQEIREIQYSASLRSFRILTAATVVRTGQSGWRQELPYGRGNTPAQLVLYPEPEQIAPMMSAFETLLGLPVNRMDR